jgi:hypothetical protein
MSAQRILIRIIVIIVLCSGLAGMSPARPSFPVLPGNGRAKLLPLADLLLPDGRLDLGTGYRGALDPSGWRMRYGANGEPVFMPGAPSTPVNAWYDLGWPADDTVKAIAIEGPDLYVGGSFVTCHNFIARRHYDSWSDLGSSLGNTVNAIAVDGPNVYVGGLAPPGRPWGLA